MKAKKGAGSGRTSTLLFLAMVAVAGCVTWYGMTNREADRGMPARGAPVTLTAVPRPSAAAMDGAALEGPSSGLPTRLILERAGIDAPIAGVGVVVKGGKAAWETAWTSVGHHIDSALPGQPGNMVLTGHVSVVDRAYVPYFAKLDAVQVGDVVEVLSGTTAYRYRVDSIETVAPDDLRVLRSDHRSRVTLITCTRDLKRRVVVTGSLVTA